jgi:hypothetical protein
MHHVSLLPLPLALHLPRVALLPLLLLPAAAAVWILPVLALTRGREPGDMRRRAVDAPGDLRQHALRLVSAAAVRGAEGAEVAGQALVAGGAAAGAGTGGGLT